jgi:hypothetical protein
MSVVSRDVGVPFDSCMAELYRNGRDSVQPRRVEMGIGKKVAMVTIADTNGARTLRYRRARAVCEQSYDLNIGHGDLVVDKGSSEWNHGIPKTKDARGFLLMMTFRQMLPKSDPSTGRYQIPMF